MLQVFASQFLPCPSPLPFWPSSHTQTAKPAGSLPQPAPSAGGSRQRSLTGRCGMVVLTCLLTQVLPVPPRSLRKRSSSASSIRAGFVEISVSFCWRCRPASVNKKVLRIYLPIYLPRRLFIPGPQASCERFIEIHLYILNKPEFAPRLNHSVDFYGLYREGSFCNTPRR